VHEKSCRLCDEVAATACKFRLRLAARRKRNSVRLAVSHILNLQASGGHCYNKPEDGGNAFRNILANKQCNCPLARLECAGKGELSSEMRKSTQASGLQTLHTVAASLLPPTLPARTIICKQNWRNSRKIKNLRRQIYILARPSLHLFYVSVLFSWDIPLVFAPHL